MAYDATYALAHLHRILQATPAGQKDLTTAVSAAVKSYHAGAPFPVVTPPAPPKGMVIMPIVITPYQPEKAKTKEKDKA